MNTAIAVKALIFDQDTVLTIKRRDDDVHKPGAWDIPGGRLGPGENPYEGLAREISEETALAVDIHEPVGVQHFSRDDGQQITMLIFSCSPKSTAVALSEEHTAYEWISIEEAKQRLLHYDQEFATYRKLVNKP